MRHNGKSDDSPAEYLEIRTSDTTGFLKPLSPLAVKDICSDYNVDYLISFEYYCFDHYISGYSDLAFLRLYDYLVWRIYMKDGILVDDYIFTDTLYWNSHGINYWEAKERLKNTSDCIREAFWIAGNEYGKRISPYWEKVNRSLYEIRERTDSGKINVTIDKNRLQVHSLSEKKTKAFKACYNMALISESEGDIDNALTWINKAMRNKHNIYARRYNKTLQGRQKSLERLKKQTEKRNLKLINNV